jgi:hypothetical protein
MHPGRFPKKHLERHPHRLIPEKPIVDDELAIGARLAHHREEAALALAKPREVGDA